MDPAALPYELFDNIIRFLLCDDGSSLPYLLRPPSMLDRAVSLHACTLVSRTWHQEITPRLYIQIQCVGNLHSFARLWLFLRTVSEKPRLAALVQHLDLQENRVWMESRQAKVATAPKQYVKRRDCRALFNVGRSFGFAEGQLVEALRSEIRHPFIIILLGCLPNVTNLFLSLDFGDQPEVDRFNHTLNQPKVLRKLEKSTFFGTPLDHTDLTTNWPKDPTFYISKAEGVFYLPFLRELVLFNVELASISGLLGSPVTQTSPITHLTIVPGGLNQPASKTAKESLKACLELPKALVVLTLYMPCCILTGIESNPPPKNLIPNDQLWSILSAHKQSLEYLDIYAQDARYNEASIQQKPHLGPLKDFEQLRTILIQPEVLLGSINGITTAPYSLQGMLPNSLQDLTLYNTDYLAAKLEEQLAGLFNRQSAHSLKSLTLQDTLEGWYKYTSCGKVYQSPSFQRLCSDHGVECKLAKEADLLPEGGRNSLRRTQAYDLEHCLWQLEQQSRRRWELANQEMARRSA